MAMRVNLHARSERGVYCNISYEIVFQFFPCGDTSLSLSLHSRL